MPDRRTTRAHPHPPVTSPRERYEVGKRLRARVPREAQANWVRTEQSAHTRSSILAHADRGRIAALLPEKYKRMAVSPFGFFRGAARLMASDLAKLPRTGLTVQLCGDAHVRNLGAYAALDGALVFDLNDFDETMPGPWEWDVKRLATSLMLAGEESGQPQSRCERSVTTFVSAYRDHLRMFASMRFATLGRYLITRRRDEPLLSDIFRDAQRTTPIRNLQKLTVGEGRRLRFHDRPPNLEHVSASTGAAVIGSLRSYRNTLAASRRRTFERYGVSDVAFKLVGTGSVGTRDYVVLLFGNGILDPLFIQVKQELPSCYTEYLPAQPVEHQGRRVAEGQQMMQTLSDPFLGYTRFGGHDFLVRQLADHKAALDPTGLNRRTLVEYARLCGEVLAKGHARTGDAATIAGYIGRSARFEEAIAESAVAYADQTKKDYRWFRRQHRASSHA